MGNHIAEVRISPVTMRTPIGGPNMNLHIAMNPTPLAANLEFGP